MARRLGLLAKAVIGGIGGAAEQRLKDIDVEEEDVRLRARQDLGQRYALELADVQAGFRLSEANILNDRENTRLETREAGATERAKDSNALREDLAEISAELQKTLAVTSTEGAVERAKTAAALSEKLAEISADLQKVLAAEQEAGANRRAELAIEGQPVLGIPRDLFNAQSDAMQTLILSGNQSTSVKTQVDAAYRYAQGVAAGTDNLGAPSIDPEKFTAAFEKAMESLRLTGELPGGGTGESSIPEAPTDPADREDGMTYRSPTGRLGRWNAEQGTWDPVE